MEQSTDSGGSAWDHAITPETCAAEVLDSVPQVMRFVRAEMRRHRAASLSVPQFRALMFLHRQPGACLSDIAEHLGVTAPTASAIVDRLVRREMVDRVADPAERRRLILTLTPAGAEHLLEARAATRGRVASALAALSSGDLRKIYEGVALLRETVKEVAAQDAD